jgi:hypothetical protein
MSKSIPFVPLAHKRGGRGKHVKFELADPKQLHVVIVTPEGIRRAIVDQPSEIETFLAKMQRAADGRLVGIYEPASLVTVPGLMRQATNDDGSPKVDDNQKPIMELAPEGQLVVPAVIVPQRRLMVNGGHNLYWAPEGEVMAHRLMIPADKAINVELVLDLTDFPQGRVVHPNYDPKAAAKRTVIG